MLGIAVIFHRIHFRVVSIGMRLLSHGRVGWKKPLTHPGSCSIGISELDLAAQI